MIGSVFILLAAVIGLPLVYYLWGFFAQRRIQAKLIANWSKPEALRNLDKDELGDVANYYFSQRETSPSLTAVDDTTWSDLDMDSVFTSIDASTSILGSEVLYSMLREQGTAMESLQKRQTLAKMFQANQEVRLKTQTALFGIGRSAYHGAWRYLFSASFQYPKLPWIYPVLAVMPTLFLLLGILNVYFLFVAAGAFLINLIVHFRSQTTWRNEVIALRHLGAVLKAAHKFGKINCLALSPKQAELNQYMKKLRTMRFLLPLFGIETLGDIAILVEYFKIFFMLDMVSLVAIVKIINRQNEAVRGIYASVGEIDACLSIAQLSERNACLCQPEFIRDLAVTAQKLYHPLVKGAVANDVYWQRNMLISGSNASGKSTFIKAVAVNIILAQSLYLCFAAAFELCRGQPMSAMAVRDSISTGESYFIVEIKSLKRILDQMDKGMVYCFIDEILRGTNTIERIAASASVLESLVGKNTLCMAATHDIELTRILAEQYDNRHFSEIVDEDGVRFDFLLKPGPTQTRNAIRLLSQLGYPENVITKANNRAVHFEDAGVWR